MMSGLTVFDGKGDVIVWEARVKAKLVSKGYKSQLLDALKPPAPAQAQQGQPAPPDLRSAWEANVDKALGIILLYLEPDIAVQFQVATTPETLFKAIRDLYSPDIEQEIERLELAFADLTYDGQDPIE